MKNQILIILFLLIFLTTSPNAHSWWLYSSSKTKPSSFSSTGQDDQPPNTLMIAVEFEAAALDDDPKGLERLDKARGMLGGTNPCWISAYQSLFSSCSEIFASDEKKSRLAWLLSNCFQKSSGRDPLPFCSTESPMKDCLRKLKESEYNTYREFYLETHSMCHQLQSKAFKIKVESLVNELKDTAISTEEKLEVLEGKSDNLLANSNQIQESITSIDEQTQQVGNTLTNMLGYMDDIVARSKALNEQAKGIATSQDELLEGQGKMQEKMEESVAKVEESYKFLIQDIEDLQKKAAQAEELINKHADAFSLKMHNLQGKSDNIAAMARISMEQQKELLQSQSKALQGLQSLTKFQSEAFEESRVSLQQIVGFARGQHKELKEQQEQLLQTQAHLFNNSKSMLKAQEEFESKQANMFATIEKIFELHNRMLMESRLIKTVCFYVALIIVLYMLTSTRQTYSIRCDLYFGLCVAFATECAILYWIAAEYDQESWSRTAVRAAFCAYAVFRLVYSYFTFRDYDVINHKLLKDLIEKVNWIVRGEDSGWDNEHVDSEVDWLSWVEEELPEDVSVSEDPTYMPPPQENEGHEENSTAPSENKYNLRHRSRRYL